MRLEAIEQTLSRRALLKLSISPEKPHLQVRGVPWQNLANLVAVYIVILPMV